MTEEQETIITSLSEKLPYHAYIVNLGANNGSFILSAQTLLDIAEFVEANHNTLKQEAQEDTNNRQNAQEETTEIPQIKQEWRYRTKDLLL
jgi:FtsZ-binding cell division protein ZapB